MFALDKPVGKDSSVSLRDHLRQVEKMTGREIPELHPDPLPPPLALLWNQFIDFYTGSTAWSELDSWMKVRGVCLKQWEVDAFRALIAEHKRAVNA